MAYKDFATCLRHVPNVTFAGMTMRPRSVAICNTCLNDQTRRLTWIVDRLARTS